MKVYNILGQEVTTLINKEMKAGYHMIKWNGQNKLGIKVASGMYIYQLLTPEKTQTMKMILMK